MRKYLVSAACLFFFAAAYARAVDQPSDQSVRETVREIEKAADELAEADLAARSAFDARLDIYQGYDSNPERLPGKPADGQRYDLVTTLRPSVNLSLYDGGPHEFALSTSLYASIHADHHDLDLLGFTQSIEYACVAKPVIVSVPVSGGYYALDGEPYASTVSIAPRILWEQADSWTGSCRVTLRRTDFFDDNVLFYGFPPAGFAPNMRSNNSSGVAVEEWYMFGQGGAYRVKAGASIERENANDDQWSLARFSPYVALDGPVPWVDGLRISAQASYTQDEYANPNMFFGGARERDKTWRADLQASYPLPLNGKAGMSATVTAGVTAILCDSNIPSVEYDRLVATAGLLLKF
jgi:hypothetical protein